MRMILNKFCLGVMSTENTLVRIADAKPKRWAVRYRRVLLPVLLLVLILQPTTRTLTLDVLSEAFIQVSAFVAATLAVYYGLSHVMAKFKWVQLSKNKPSLQLLSATLLGVLPGCGGAIIVITQFTKGQVQFGSVVAVLTATMGDAAFVLLAQEPLDGLVVMAVSMIVGFVTGFIVNLIHRPDYLRPSLDKLTSESECKIARETNKKVMQVSAGLWRILLIPALVIALFTAFQVDVNQLASLPSGLIEMVGAIICLFVVVLWSLSSKGGSYEEVTSEEKPNFKVHWMDKVALDTQFITSWVVASFLIFELSVHWLGIDLASSLTGLGSLVILLAVFIGFLPGCGPQILITGLYLQHAIPFSAQLANAISNDGDALFPAIALAPKAAIVATLYSAVPALLVGYGYFYLFE